MVTLLAQQLERQRLDDVNWDSHEVFSLCGPSPSLEGGLHTATASESGCVFLGYEEDDPDCPARKRRRSKSIPGACSPPRVTSTWNPKPSKHWAPVKRSKTRTPPVRSVHRRTQSSHFGHAEEGGFVVSPVPRPASTSSFDWQCGLPDLQSSRVTKTAVSTLHRNIVLLRSNSQPCIADQTVTSGPQRPRSSGGKKRQRERPSVDFFKMSESRSSENLGLKGRSSPVLFISWPEGVLRDSSAFREAGESASEEAMGGRESGYGSIEGWSRCSDAFSENELDISKIEEN